MQKTQPGVKSISLLADKLIEFAKKHSSLDINEFSLGLMIKPEDLAAFTAQSEYFADAYDIALSMIGSRRERLAQEGVINQQIVLATMPLYNPQYKRWIKCLKYKDDVGGKAKFVVVEIPRVSSTGLVPDRETNNE